MLRKQSLLTTVFQLLCLLLFLSWLGFLISSPVVVLHLDTPGYQADADHMFDHSDYGSQRPFLFPLFIRIANILHIKSSILALLFNAGSILYFVWIAGGKGKLFSLKNTLVMIGFLILPSPWCFSGAKITETILPGVEAWIVVCLISIFLPVRRTTPAMVMWYALVISFLSITLKPWIMPIVILGSLLLLLATLLFRFFRAYRESAGILLIITVMSNAIAYKYIEGKSTMLEGNMVYIFLTSDISNDLRQRLSAEKDSTSESAALYRDALADIKVINEDYGGNPFGPPPDSVHLFRIRDHANRDKIIKVFSKVYLQRPENLWVLLKLGLYHFYKPRYEGFGWTDMNYIADVYGPGYFWFNTVSGYCALLLLLAALWYLIGRRRRNPEKRTDPRLIVFCLILLGINVAFAVFLGVAGGTEYQRSTLPAAFFELLAIVLFFQRSTMTGPTPD